MPSRLMYSPRYPGSLPRAYKSFDEKSVYYQDTRGNWFECFDEDRVFRWVAGIPFGVDIDALKEENGNFYRDIYYECHKK